MFEFTEDNYIRWGYTKEPFSLPPSHPMDVNLWWDCSGSNMPSRLRMSLREETLRSARLIAEQAHKPLRLFLSGGIDSEVMLHAFRAIQVDFECACLEYEHGLNHHEVQVSTELAKEYNLPLVRIRIDPFKLWYRLPQWLKPFRLESGAMVMMTQAMYESQNRFCVIGGNPQFVVREQRRLELLFKPSMLCHMMAFIELDNPGVNSFHMYSPQQYSALLEHPVHRAWASQILGTGIHNFDQIKPIIYQMEFPEIHRTRPKWTGEEMLRNHIADLWRYQWAENRPFNPRIQRREELVREELQRYLRD